MRTLFIGGTKRGYLTLKRLIRDGANVVGIVSLLQNAHEVERYEKPIKTLAEEYKIPLYETKWLKDKYYEQIIAENIKPDIAFVVGCRVLLPKDIYKIPSLGTFAVHDSFLPDYRGFAPLNWSIINGEDNTGVTLYCLNELMDGGDIVAQKHRLRIMKLTNESNHKILGIIGGQHSCGIAYIENNEIFRFHKW
jgi:methionyl-tRNA formyltransferase